MKPAKLQPALLGGAFIGVLSALPVISAGNLCCCLWIVGGGVLAAYLMQQNHPFPVTPGAGAGVGALAGVFGAFMYVVVALPVNAVMAPLQRRVMEQIMTNRPDVPPELRDMVGQMSGGYIGIVISFVLMISVGVLFATLGGLIGALIFKKTVPPPTPPPPPPTVDVLPPV